MATNSVQFIYELVDKYSPQIKKMARQQKNLTDKIKKTSQGLDRFRTRLRSVGQQAIKTGQSLSLRLTLPIVTALGFMTREIVGAEEAFNKFSVTFQAVGEEAELVAKDLRDNFGLSEKAAKELLAGTGDLLTGFGFSGAAALDMSEQVNKLAVDLASFQNVDIKRASEAVTKGLLGETESMKLLGIVVRQNDKAFIALVESLQRTEKVSLQQAKAMATLRIAQQQSKNSIGDFGRTSASAANQMRLFTGRLSDFALAFRDEVLPVFTPIITAINKFIVRMGEMSPVMRKTILIVAVLVAALGPLIILLASIGVAITFITLPIILVTAAVLALIAGVILLVNNWKKMMAFLTRTGEILKTTTAFAVLKFVFEGISSTMLITKKIVMDVIDSLAKLGEMIINIPIIKDIGQGLKNIGDSIKNIPILESIADKFGDPSSALGGGLGFALNPGGGIGAQSIAVDVNLRAPKDTIESSKVVTKGKGLKTGLNLREAN